MPDTQGSPCVPVARIEALIRLLGHDEMTPTAVRMFEQVLDEYRTPAGLERARPAGADPAQVAQLADEAGGQSWTTSEVERCLSDLAERFPCHLHAEDPHTQHECWSSGFLIIWTDQ